MGEIKAALIECNGSLDAVLIRRDGTHRDLGTLSKSEGYRLVGRPIQWWRSLWKQLRMHGIIPITMGFATFLALYGIVDKPEAMQALFNDSRVRAIIFGCLPLAGLVTQAGANFLAADMATGGATPDISSMNYHDSGTNTTAATSTDSGLGTAAGPTTRATGVQTNPAANQYKSVGTITYAGVLAITEWGLFNKASRGSDVMWDRRVFAAVNVVDTDSIAFSYTLTLSGGGT